MCGIVGFTGKHQAAPILLDGLSKLEYRGYDSAGIAVRDGSSLAEVVKSTGKLINLYEKTDGGNVLTGTCGIGHTRWATHSEAYAAGELKHGTISLIEDGTLVIGVLTQSDLYEKTISNMVECKSRGAYLMGLTSFGHYEIEDTADFVTYIPKVDEHFIGSLAVIPLQLLGYYVSVSKGLDVDKPRNLAKSVTVE